MTEYRVAAGIVNRDASDLLEPLLEFDVSADTCIMFTRARPLATIGACLAIAACGSAATPASSTPSAATFKATLAHFTTALSEHDAARACEQITPTFWQAMAGKLDASLSAAGRPSIPIGGCAEGLRYVLSRLPLRIAPSAASLQVQDVVLHGSTASAIVANGPSREPARFVQSASGRWRVDCCTGAQLDRLAAVQYRIASASMEPTLAIGQVVRVDNAVLKARAPRIGEIVSIHPPAGVVCSNPRQGENLGQPCGAAASAATADVVIKRVVGLPGDRIAIFAGRVVTDGVPQREPYINPCPGAGALPLCNFPRSIVVPSGTYFVLGDNRGDSVDSRFYGPVRRAWIVGLVRH